MGVYGRSPYGRSPYSQEGLPATPVAIDSLSPAIVGQDGGVELTLTGEFPSNTDLDVHLGLTGTVNDPKCYGGQGYGLNPQSEDGVTLTVYTPRFSPGEKGSGYITVAYNNETYVFGSLIVLGERVFLSKQFEFRKNFPRFMALGTQLRDKDRL